MDAKTRTKTLCMLKNYLLESRDSGLTDYAIETPSNLMQHSFSSGTRASLFCSGIHDPKRKRRPDRVIKRSADVRGCWNNIWRSLAPRTLGLSQCCQKNSGQFCIKTCILLVKPLIYSRLLVVSLDNLKWRPQCAGEISISWDECRRRWCDLLPFQSVGRRSKKMFDRTGRNFDAESLLHCGKNVGETSPRPRSRRKLLAWTQSLSGIILHCFETQFLHITSAVEKWRYRITIVSALSVVAFFICSL